MGLKLGTEKAFESGAELPEKVDAVFHTSGEATLAHSMSSVKTGGTIVTCGAHSGKTIPVDVSRVFVEQIDIRGSYFGTWEEFKDLISFVVATSVKPHIGLLLPMKQVGVGFHWQKIGNGEAAGRIVVKM